MADEIPLAALCDEDGEPEGELEEFAVLVAEAILGVDVSTGIEHAIYGSEALEASAKGGDPVIVLRVFIDQDTDELMRLRRLVVIVKDRQQWPLSFVRKTRMQARANMRRRGHNKP